ncbi:FAD-binding oxidoreductase [Shewanella mesophila]|nr:FAD-binding oxidoreductase [Shewanella mesophila]
MECRAPLTADIEADVAIIGAGYTGLWTAYYLKQKSPSLKIVVVDASVAGEGASGRNGGWLMGSFVGDTHYLAGLSGTGFSQAKRLIQSPIDEVSRVLKQHQVDCDWVHSGNVRVAARYPEQLQALRAEIALLHRQGFTEQDYRWLEGCEFNQAINMRKGAAAIYTPHCATIHPLKLVRGLARIVESLGVTLYEHSPVTAFGSGLVKCETGSIRADIIVPALEGYQAEVSQLGRYTLPVQSLLIATEPLSESLWQQIGLADRATFSDAARQVTYGQRSKDNRLVFGARGGYRFGGETQTQFATGSDAFAWRARLMVDLFPALKDINITHRWGGTLAMARKFAPHAIFDKRNGIALVGGYGGEGVGASNLFARTLSDLILERETELSHMPWAHLSEIKQVLTPWEPEPFRWLTYQLINKIFSWEERLCLQSNPSSLQKRIAIQLAQRLDSLMH